jgi:hypothetical protein
MAMMAMTTSNSMSVKAAFTEGSEDNEGNPETRTAGRVSSLRSVRWLLW